MFDALRLSVEVLAEILAAEVLAEVLAAEVLAVEVLAKVLAEILAEILAELTAEITAEITSGTKLEVLLIAVCCWNSLESYTSFSTQSFIIVSSYL